MSKSHVDACIDCASFYVLFKEFLTNLPLKIIIQCAVDQHKPLVLQDLTFLISPNLQVLSSHFSEVTDLVDEKCVKEKISQFQSMFNARTSTCSICVDIKKMSYEFCCFSSDLDIQLKNLENCSTQKLSASQQVLTICILCFFSTFGLVVKTIESVANNNVSNSVGSYLAILRGTEPVGGLMHPEDDG